MQEEAGYFPSSPRLNVKTNDICYAIFDSEDTIAGYIDLTGHFPKRSSQGNQYILVGYHYDSNHIMGVPVKNCKGAIGTEVWQSIHDTFKKAESLPNTCVLDNKTSQELRDAFNQENITYQLISPYKHRTNLAE